MADQPATDQLLAMADDLATAKARLGRLQRDNKAAISYREGRIEEARQRVAAIERAIAAIMTEVGRHRLETDYGTLELKTSWSTAVDKPLLLKFAKEACPDLVKTVESITLAALEEAGAIWNDGNLTLDGEIVPGVERQGFQRGHLPGTKLALEEPSDGPNDWHEHA